MIKSVSKFYVQNTAGFENLLNNLLKSSALSVSDMAMKIIWNILL